MRAPALPVRVRLAAVTALLVVAVGSVLLAASYWLLMVRLPDSVVFATPTGQVRVDVAGSGGADALTPLSATCAPTPTTQSGPTSAAGGCLGDGYVVEVGTGSSPPAAVGRPAEPAAAPLAAANVVGSAVQDYEAQLRTRFAAQSAVLLLALAVPAVAVGGFAARRALRPVHAMTAAARRLSADSLTDRLPTQGPRDELRELAETFNAMLDRVGSAFDRERRLMANVSHELRTPLANQHVALEVGLEDPAATADDLRRLAQTALAQNVRARRLIEEILVLARSEQDGTPDDGAEATDLAAAARHAVDGVGALPDAVPGLDVRLDLAPAPVGGQAVLVERLVGNLVENAVRHNVSGGFVRVATSVVEGAGRVVVENSGPVVPPDAVDGLFEPFRRGAGGGGDRVRSDRGVGLGLCVVAAVARRYGARVEAAARAEGGLRVAVTLPGAASGVRRVTRTA